MNEERNVLMDEGCREAIQNPVLLDPSLEVVIGGGLR